ncbi:MAG TPA: protein kinase [Gemmatimonadales bacterium]|nr:protein kinase [Gemmatimonadales bacterium]
MSFAPGTVLDDRYEIGREIGRGGYSIVYLATDRTLGRQVAIKLLVPPPSAAQTAKERLRREVLAARDLGHTNIVAIYDFVDAGERGSIVMEYIDGPDLALKVAEGGPLPAEMAARVGREVALALSAAHRRGILHRDVKPSNILLDPDGRARLTDFGSAKLEGMSSVTGTGALVGTLDYLAPEVVAGSRGDARADLYALGMTLYFLVTGRLPERPSPHLPPPPSPDGHRPSVLRGDLPAWFDDAVACATTALPADRFSSAALLADALSLEPTGEWRVPAKVSHYLTFCLLCGSDEPLGLGLCSGCAGAAPQELDGMVLVERPTSAAEREHTHARLRHLTGTAATPAALEAASRGERVVARVPLAGAQRVLERLSAEGISARIARSGWAPLPTSLYGVAGSMVLMGGLAGALVSPVLLYLSPLLSLVILLEAQRQVRQPLLKAPGTSGTLTGPARERLALAVSRLPSGTALSLLADLARNAQAVLSRLPADAVLGIRSEVEELVVHACDAAADLAELEDSLDRLERQRARPGRRTSGGWHTTVARVERSRDALVQKLLDAITTLGEARLRAVEATAADTDRLSELSHEMRAEVVRYAEARREMEALL